MPTRWRAFRSLGSGRPRRWRASASAARSASLAGTAASSGRRSGAAVLGAVRLDDLARHAVLAELGLDHAHAARGMAVALLTPPSGKGGVINVPELAEALEDRIDHRLGHPGPAQAALGLPLRPRARPEVPHRDLHRRGRVGAARQPSSGGAAS